MKNVLFKYILFIPLTLVAFMACRDDDGIESKIVDGNKPKAQFSYVADAMTVAFTDKSVDAESYYWDFGDGATSTEKSPVHTYAAAGNYTIKLKVNSVAGYSDTFEGGPVFVADKVVAAFSSVAELGLSVYFNASSSKNIVSAKWDFGDGTQADGLTISHAFAAAGQYTVKMTATGLLGDKSEVTQNITVIKNMNLLKGSNMEADAAEYWHVLSEGMNMKWGYMLDKPNTGQGGCLRFEGVSVSTNSLIYQGVQVLAGKKYKLSAQIKVPAGGMNAYLQFYIAKNANSASDFIESSGDPNTNHFLCLNSWNGWGNNTTGTVAADGDLYQIVRSNGSFGLGASTGGIYTATETRTVYIGIKAFTQVRLGDTYVDTVLFELQED